MFRSLRELFWKASDAGLFWWWPPMPDGVWGPAVFPRVQDWLGLNAGERLEEIESSPELADSVMARVQEFRRGEARDQLALGERELTSVLRYSVPGLIPGGCFEASR